MALPETAPQSSASLALPTSTSSSVSSQAVIQQGSTEMVSQHQEESIASKIPMQNVPLQQQAEAQAALQTLPSDTVQVQPASSSIAPIIQAPGKSYQLVPHSKPMQKTDKAVKNATGSIDFNNDIVFSVANNSSEKNLEDTELIADELNLTDFPAGNISVLNGISKAAVLTPSAAFEIQGKNTKQEGQDVLTCSDVSPLLFTPSQSPHTPSPLPNVTKLVTPKSTNSNRKPMFKQQQSILTAHSEKAQINKAIPQDKLKVTSEILGSNKPTNVRHTPLKQAVSPVNSTLSTEEFTPVKRRVKVKKRKGVGGFGMAAKKSKDEKAASPLSIKQSEEKAVVTSVFKCASCSHKLVTGKVASDVQEQRTTPPFLRDAFAESLHKTGCFFLSTSTSRLGLQASTDATNGMNTKYVEQEEICVQFLYCGQCVKSSTPEQQAQVVGAQVQLAAGSGARFSKGQMWLFYNGVKSESEQQSSK